MRNAVAFPGHAGATRAEGCSGTTEKMGRSLGVAAAAARTPRPSHVIPELPQQERWLLVASRALTREGRTQPPGGRVGFHVPFSSLLL